MNDDVMKYAAGTALGLAGAAGFGALLAKICSVEKRRTREYAKYIMEHPTEYETYQDVQRVKKIESDNEELRSYIRSTQAELDDCRQNYKDSMRKLKTYVDKDMENLERTKKNLNAYFGEENT